jgi:hypothetical protein
VLTQLACRAAHAGTTTGPGSGVGDGLGLGLSTGLGLGLGEGVGVCSFAAGDGGGASGPFGVQPTMAARDTRSTTPFLTGAFNEQRCG